MQKAMIGYIFETCAVLGMRGRSQAAHTVTLECQTPAVIRTMLQLCAMCLNHVTDL